MSVHIKVYPRSFIKCLRLTLVFMCNSALRGKFILYVIFASINKIFILARRLGTRLSFYKV